MSDTFDYAGEAYYSDLERYNEDEGDERCEFKPNLDENPLPNNDSCNPKRL